MPEKVLVHEGSIGLGMVRPDADVFVQVESRDSGPVEPPGDELSIERHGRGTGGKAQNGIRL